MKTPAKLLFLAVSLLTLSYTFSHGQGVEVISSGPGLVQFITQDISHSWRLKELNGDVIAEYSYDKECCQCVRYVAPGYSLKKTSDGFFNLYGSPGTELAFDYANDASAPCDFVYSNSWGDTIMLGSLLSNQPLSLFGWDGDGHAWLYWEVDNSLEQTVYFEIEASHNGTIFNKIATEQVIANEHSYKFVDWELPSGVSVFYRIRRYFDDGRTDVSNIVEMLNDEKEDQELVLYPNPVLRGKNSKIQVKAEDFLTVRISILDHTGRVLHTETRDFIPGQHSFTLPTNQFPTGYYFVDLTTDQDKVVRQLIITD